MKKLAYISTASLLVLLSFCKSNKSTTNTSLNAVPLNANQMTFVETRWPGTVMDDVKHGQSIFLTKCTECHANQEITSLSEKKWIHEIEDMAPKAKLSAEEKLKLTKYILSYREANHSQAK